MAIIKKINVENIEYDINATQADVATNASKLNSKDPSYYLDYDNFSNKPDLAPMVRTDVAQSFDDTQKARGRANIGAGTYSVPMGGILKETLSETVQTSLGKADTAIQNVDDKQDVFAEVEEGVSRLYLNLNEPEIVFRNGNLKMDTGTTIIVPNPVNSGEVTNKGYIDSKNFISYTGASSVTSRITPRIKTALDAPVEINTQYYLGNPARVQIVLPTTRSVGDFVEVTFYNRSSAAYLSVTSAGSDMILGTVPTSTVNSRHSLHLVYDGVYWYLTSDTISLV